MNVCVDRVGRWTIGWVFVVLGVAEMAVGVSPLLSSGPAIVAGAAVLLVLRRMFIQRYQTAFLNTFADAIDQVSRGVQAGLPVPEALRAASEESQEPVRSELRNISDSLALGIDFQTALDDASERIGLPDFRFFAITLLVQRETGGQLAETLNNLSAVLRKRKELRQKVKTMTAEGRLTAKIIGAIPFVVVGALMLISPDYIFTTWANPTGRMFLLLAFGMVMFGIVVVNRMTKPRF